MENRNAVALAMHHAGVATDMIYSTNGSGTGSLPVARALASYFKYNKGMEIARKLVYTEAEWFALIKNGSWTSGSLFRYKQNRRTLFCMRWL